MDTAKQLYDEEDYLSALHLAGASEEILGKCLIAKGIEDSFESEVKGLVSLSELSSYKMSEKTARKLINKSKNTIKHMFDENDFYADLDPKEAAKDMFKRAFTNLWRLGETISYFEAFWNEVEGR